MCQGEHKATPYARQPIACAHVHGRLGRDGQPVPTCDPCNEARDRGCRCVTASGIYVKPFSVLSLELYVVSGCRFKSHTMRDVSQYCPAPLPLAPLTCPQRNLNCPCPAAPDVCVCTAYMYGRLTCATAVQWTTGWPAQAGWLLGAAVDGLGWLCRASKQQSMLKREEAATSGRDGGSVVRGKSLVALWVYGCPSRRAAPGEPVAGLLHPAIPAVAGTAAPVPVAAAAGNTRCSASDSARRRGAGSPAGSRAAGCPGLVLSLPCVSSEAECKRHSGTRRNPLCAGWPKACLGGPYGCAGRLLGTVWGEVLAGDGFMVGWGPMGEVRC